MPVDYKTRTVGTRTPLRPLGALCIHCRHRPARPHARYAHLVGPFCSDSCRDNEYAQRNRDRQRDLADTLRRMLNLPDGRGPTLSVPEMEAMIRRLSHLLPYQGKAMRIPPRSPRPVSVEERRAKGRARQRRYEGRRAGTTS